MANVLTENVHVDDAPFVVPIESTLGIVGADFLSRLAKSLGGTYERDAEGIGLLTDFSSLKSKFLDPSRVHPLIREFYEHTTRFEMTVTSSWKPLAGLAFRVFRRFFAARVGQFNLPIDDAHSGQGLESHIDTIDFDNDRIPDVRGWVRTYAGTSTPVYVAVYVVNRLSDGVYVSIGFPLPHANLTSTLVPRNEGDHDFLLTTKRGDSKYGGHYLASIGKNEVPKRIRAVRIRPLHEEIHVYVKDNSLLTDHRFFFFGRMFLTLHYDIQRKTAPKRPLASLVEAYRSSLIKS